MARWMVMRKGADFQKIAADHHISMILARLIRNRNVQGDQEIERFLRGDLSDLRDPHTLPDIDKAASIMKSKIDSGSRIRIIGDYDVDGITSTYILFSGLKLAARGTDTYVDYRLPDRITDGYGLNERLVREAADDNIDTIMTCDNGIAAHEQIRLASELGMTVVVTDHHEVPLDKESGEEILPPAEAVVDPKRSSCQAPFKEICGGFVAYKFLQVLFELYKTDGVILDDAVISDDGAIIKEDTDVKCSRRGAISQAMLSAYMDEATQMAALATVCDVMPLEDENRIIVKEGLKRMEHTGNLGLKCLMDVTGLADKSLTAYSLGFIIGPCMNATGRLDNATRAVRLLAGGDMAEAASIAVDLKELNDSRKTMTVEGVTKASEMVDSMDKIPDILVLYLQDLHESIAGIVAGKIKEKYNRPTIVLTDGQNGAKGSGRSIEAYDMFTELSACKDLFDKFGGHKMAAGLSLPKENIGALSERLNAASVLTEDDFTQVLRLDMELPISYVTMDLVRELENLEPYGNGNAKPCFAARNIRILSGRIMGKNRNCGKYNCQDPDGNRFEMVYFGDMQRWHDFLIKRYGTDAPDRIYNNMGRGEYTDALQCREYKDVSRHDLKCRDALQCRDIVINIAYYPDINSWNGRESLQIIMNDYC
ncbi:single-stranded-DNA-specific exonuclease RecJ [Butyrivibrio sp. MC2013]|uniref:single-stranded-DNA-specific exonuclease RecJ n=1 Tax=Butyrivibrio sp. MC2013 TaxID=1280686 RepID=UPI000416FD1B|nr:single-stranded-DNA-specific exonuclease RecJ [Butyrivibrio sp. MC2013]